jgi:ketosteroid isomerase-like protein
VETSAAIARRFFREVWREGGEAVVDALLARDIVGWMEGWDVNSPEDFKQARRQLLEQDDKAVVRWTVRGTHRGTGLGVTPTHRVVSFRGITWLEFRHGRIVRGWDSWNLGGLISSLTSAGA